MDGVMAVVSGVPSAARLQDELTPRSAVQSAAITSSMRVNLIDQDADFDQLRPAWERAFDRDPNAPIFLNWWWQRGWRKVSPYPYAVLTITPTNASEPVAFLPVSIRGSANVLRVDHVREIHMGGDPGTDYNGLVCDPDHQDAAIAALVDHFSNHESWDRLMFKEVRDPRLLAIIERLPKDVADVFPRQGTCCPYTPLPPTWEEFQQQCLSYETRKSLRKKLRLCEDECRVTFMDSSNAAQHIEALVTLAKNRTRDDMDDNVHRCDRIFEWAAKGGIASILLVWHDQTPIAGMGAFIDKKANSFCFYLTGYNENYGHYSPGRVVNALAIRHAIDMGCTTLDFLRGDEPYKFQFGAQRRYNTHVVAVRKSLHSATRIAVENVRRRPPAYHAVMPRVSPLREVHQAWINQQQPPSIRDGLDAHRPGAAIGEMRAAAIDYLPWGDADEHGRPLCQIVAGFGEVEAEYASLRRGAGLIDLPNRATLTITGTFNDRRDFLNRMLTQEMKVLAPGLVKESFWLNRKGRLEADLLVIELGDRMLLDVDTHQAATTVKTLGEFLFAEDVVIKDASDQFHRLALHGKMAMESLAAAVDPQHGKMALEPLRAQAITVDGVPVVVARRDQVGEPGLELIIPAEHSERVWHALLAADRSLGQDRHRIRPVGWLAFNIARIEAGTPLFNIDFGTSNLPHETGILKRRVSFTKGCYLGQEIVARMESLGKPKQTLVGLRVSKDLLPVAGGQVFAKNADPQAASMMGDEIGVVTSSTLSPMLGAASIAFAMIKTAHAAEGNTLLVNAEGEQAEAVVSPLQFWPSVETPPANPTA